MNQSTRPMRTYMRTNLRPFSQRMIGLALAWACGSLIPASAGAQTAAPSIAGEWRLEFRSAGSSADPEAKPTPWLTFDAMVVQVDSGVGGSMRSTGPTGQFGCKRRSETECAGGRMRLSWDEQDWQTFEFKLTPGSMDKGTGRAEIRFPTGQTDRYTFTMTRTRGS